MSNEDEIVDIDGFSGYESAGEDSNVDVEENADDGSGSDFAQSSQHSQGSSGSHKDNTMKRRNNLRHHNRLERVRREDIKASYRKLSNVLKKGKPSSANTNSRESRDSILEEAITVIQQRADDLQRIRKMNADFKQLEAEIRARAGLPPSSDPEEEQTTDDLEKPSAKKRKRKN